MKIKYFTYIAILFSLLTACTTGNDDALSIGDIPLFPSDDNWKEELLDGASVTVKRFEPGDEATRSSIYYDGQGLVFGWKRGDLTGLYPTAKDASKLKDEEKSGLLSKEQDPHPSLSQEPDLLRVDPDASQQTIFACQEETTSQTARISNGSSDFFWDDIVRWTAYFPYMAPTKQEENYEKRYFSYTGQKQLGLTNIGEYFDYEDASTQSEKTTHLNKYHLSEVNACQHLGKYDIMISPETKWEDGVRINFYMAHIGAIARLYLKVPEENLVIKDVKLICNKAIFYEGGSFTLYSHPYNASEKYKGVNFAAQIKPEGDPVKEIQLDFSSDCITKKTGSGNYGPYVVAYFMMYPITYNPVTDGDIFAYVTAYKQGDNPSKEVHYVSDPLSGKTMKSGNYYQWTSATHPDDGLYPIELTATLLPWQDIVGSGINTDLEK